MMDLDNVSLIQWFPGHMTKAMRLIESELKNVDLLIEIIDARAPLSSRNTLIEKAAGGKPIFIVLNKADLADEASNIAFMRYFRGRGEGAATASSKDMRSAKKALAEAVALADERIMRLREKGITGAKPRAMVVGMPNVGKSTFINCVSGSSKAKAEDRPGVTKGKQWVSLPGLDLLDMPGVLLPKFDDKKTALLLAACGTIKDQILDVETVAAYLLETLAKLAPDSLSARYKLNDLGVDGWTLLSQTAKNRGMMLPGAEPDVERAANTVLDEFRAGKLGRVTLESVPS